MADGRTERGAAAGSSPRPAREHNSEGRLSPLVDGMRDRVTAELNARKDRASDALADLAGTVRRLGEPLHEDAALDPLAGYADEAADRIERLANGLRERDVSELADEVRGLARRRPAAFAAAGFAAGLLAARFLKSSKHDADSGTRRATGRPGSRADGSRASGRNPASRRERQPKVRLDATADHPTR